MTYFFTLYSAENSESIFEYCYYIELNNTKDNLPGDTWIVLFNLITNNGILLGSSKSILSKSHDDTKIIEFGPNLSVTTAWSSNAINILKKSGVKDIVRIERSVRTVDVDYFDKNYDRMTQIMYDSPLVSFNPSENKIETYQQMEKFVEPLSINNDNLKNYSDIFELDIPHNDLAYYYVLFKHTLNRNSNTAELMTLSQLNNEHSRHRFFNGNLNVYHQILTTNEKVRINDPNFTGVLSSRYVKDSDNESLMDKIKKPYLLNKNNSIIAFKDNASAIKGLPLIQMSHFWNTMMESSIYQADSDDEVSVTHFSNNNIYLKNRHVIPRKITYHPTLKAETHNFPTGVAPYEGAATGVGGRIRDTISIGRGGIMGAGMAGYSVGNLKTDIVNSKDNWLSSIDNSPLDILIKASDGASDYGNKIGEPIILGFTRSFGEDLKYKKVKPIRNPMHQNTILSGNLIDVSERKEWLKPIMYSSGIGFVQEDHIEKQCKPGMSIIRVGGPAYRVGVNGGSVSSKIHDTSSKNINYSAVQRGDPEMESKIVKFIYSCLQLGINNPIMNIHDQGAGGMANVTSEICQPFGALVYMSQVLKGDDTLSDIETWLAEYQEQVTMLVNNYDIHILNILAERENVPITNIGSITNDDLLNVVSLVNITNDNYDNYKDMMDIDDDDDNLYDDSNEKYINLINLPVSKIDNELPRHNYTLIQPYYVWNEEEWYQNMESCYFGSVLKHLLNHVSVGSKRFLTSKVDRSVGMVSQQQTVGINQTPLSDYAIVASNYFGSKDIIPGEIIYPGVVSSIGEQPIKGIYDIDKMVRLTVAEMLTNMIWAGIEDFSMIRCAANWMWANNDENDKYLLRQAVKTLTDTLETLGIAVDGGKDSLSMSVKTNEHIIKSPNTLVLTGYVTTNNIMEKVNPGFVHEYNSIVYINLSHKNNRMGGSMMAQICNAMSKTSDKDIPDFESLTKFPALFDCIQYHIKAGNIAAGHDVSDGGLITTLVEMCFPNNLGCNIKFDGLQINNCYQTFMSEEPGLVIEYNLGNNVNNFIEDIKTLGYHQTYIIGKVVESNVNIIYNDTELLSTPIYKLQKEWEHASHIIEIEQIGKKLATSELENLMIHPLTDENYCVSPLIFESLKELEKNNLIYENVFAGNKHNLFSPKVAILREEGSNGDREMRSCFMLAGFSVYDIHMNDISSNKINLSDFVGIVFVGGFSYSDTFGSAQGWVSSIRNNSELRQQFNNFYERTDTFSLGVCNGCQLMALLGWVPFESRFIQNDSKRFESRYSIVNIPPNNSIMLSGLENMNFGIWTAHGEGKYYSEEVDSAISNKRFINNSYYNKSFPMRYIDYSGQPTTVYPYNPNGSPEGIAAVVSDNGRHLAMMPHPERSYLKWQLPYCPPMLEEQFGNITPWFLMFKNAYDWCQQKSNDSLSDLLRLHRELEELDDIEDIDTNIDPNETFWDYDY